MTGGDQDRLVESEGKLRPVALRGIVSALWSLLTPPAFDVRQPDRQGLCYRAHSGRGVAPRVDVYLPPAGGPRPSVVVVHGGGFVIGSRRMKPVRFLAGRLVEAGFAVAAVDYRLIFRGGRLDEALDDVATAVAWWRDSADRFSLDPERVSLLGLSAGASLILLNAAARSDGLDRLVSIFGVYDFSRLGGWARLMNRLLFRSAEPENWRRRSPLADCRMPQPVLLVHGTADSLVSVTDARDLAAERQRLNLPVSTAIFAGQPHAFLNNAAVPAAGEAVREILHFLSGGDGPAEAPAAPLPKRVAEVSTEREVR